MIAKKSTSKKDDYFSIWDENIGKFIQSFKMQEPWYKEREAAKRFNNFRHPFFWYMSVIELNEVAEYLQNQYNIYKDQFPEEGSPRVYMFPDKIFMLAGMAIENLFKTRLLCGLSYPISDSDFKKVAKGNHDLAKLLKKTGMQNNRGDRKICDTLTHYVRWVGKFPLPRDLNEMKKLYFLDVPDKPLWDAYTGLKAKFEPKVLKAIRNWAKGV